MKRLNIKAAATHAVGVAAGAIGGQLASGALPTVDPMIKNAGMIVLGSVLAATSKAGSALAAAGSGLTAIGSVGLASDYGVIAPAAPAAAPVSGYRMGNIPGQLPVIGRNGERMNDGILGTPHAMADGYNGAGSFA